MSALDRFQPDRPGPAHPTPLRVLIVDDSPEDTETFRRYLRRWPGQEVEVSEAALGETAIEHLSVSTPDLMLVDYQLPDMTGLEFLSVARPECAVIVLTGVGDEDVAVSAMKAGAQDYLVKGRLSADALWRAATHALDKLSLARDLERAQSRTLNILQSVTDGFLSCDRELVVGYLNPAAAHLLGPGAAELLGQPLDVALPWIDATPLGALLRRALDDQQTVTLDVQVPGAGVGTSPGPELEPGLGLGSQWSEGQWLDVRVYPSKGGLSVYFADITAPILARERERRASARMEHLYGASLAMNTVRSRQEVASMITRQAVQALGARAATLALLGHGEQGLEVVATERDVSGEESLGAPLPQPGELLAPGAGSPLYQAVHSGATVLPDLHGASPLGWAALPIIQEGQVLGALGLLVDPHELSGDDQTLLLTFAQLCAHALDRSTLYEAERQQRLNLERRVQERTAALQRSNRELEQFAYVASHDLKEPLRSVSSFAQLLQSRYRAQLDERADGYLNIVIEGAQRMFTLIEDVLAMARVGTPVNPRPMDLSPLVHDAFASLSPLTHELGAQLSVGPLPRLTGDPTQFAQVFRNLLANALKFRRPGVSPQVQVSAHPVPGGWQFSVSDNGIGIEEQYLTQVFTIFQRLHNRQTYAGNGIGLSVCQKIVEQHGGRIWLESQPGHGTTAHFTLPERPALS